MDFIHDQTQEFYKLFLRKKEEVIKAALLKNGIDYLIDEDYIKNNFTLVNYEGSEFETLFYKYGTPEEVRIITIQKTPDINLGDKGEAYQVTASCKYY